MLYHVDGNVNKKSIKFKFKFKFEFELEHLKIHENKLRAMNCQKLLEFSFKLIFVLLVALIFNSHKQFSFNF